MTTPITTGRGSFARDLRPHYVYEFWAADQCLYVGLSAQPAGRIGVHSNKPWWAKVRRIEAQVFPDRHSAMLHEAGRITELEPLHNWQHTEAASGSRSGHGTGGVAFSKADVGR